MDEMKRMIEKAEFICDDRKWLFLSQAGFFFYFFLTRLILGHRRNDVLSTNECVNVCDARSHVTKVNESDDKNVQKWQGGSVSSVKHPLLMPSHSCAACVYTLPPNLFELQIYRSSEASHFISLSLSISHSLFPQLAGRQTAASIV